MRVWREQPESFFDEAVIEAGGTMVEARGECKQGMDVVYQGTWCFHPLVVSLANTQEPLHLVNRSANRPSHAIKMESSWRKAPFRNSGLHKHEPFPGYVTHAA